MGSRDGRALEIPLPGLTTITMASAAARIIKIKKRSKESSGLTGSAAAATRGCWCFFPLRLPAGVGWLGWGDAAASCQCTRRACAPSASCQRRRHAPVSAMQSCTSPSRHRIHYPNQLANLFIKLLSPNKHATGLDNSLKGPST
jgi:hypothetical protein